MTMKQQSRKVVRKRMTKDEFFLLQLTEKVLLGDHQDVFYFDQLAIRVNEFVVEGMPT